MSIFEVAMLICFGVSWPISIAKSIRTRIVSGKSPLFMAVVCFGYAFGIMHKVLHSMDWVIVLYTLNMVLVAIDLILYFHYVPKKHQAEASARANSRVHSISECRAKHVSEMGNNRLSSHLTKSLSSKSSGNA